VAVLALIWREGAGFGLNRERGEGGGVAGYDDAYEVAPGNQMRSLVCLIVAIYSVYDTLIR
jgi:hypothetical protein